MDTQFLLFLLLFVFFVCSINSSTVYHVQNSTDFHEVFRNESCTVLLLERDIELRNYHGWLTSGSDEKAVDLVDSEIEISSALPDTLPRPFLDLDSRPLHTLLSSRSNLTSKRVHYLNVDIPSGNELKSIIENRTVVLKDSIVEVFIKTRPTSFLVAKWRYFRSLLEDPSSLDFHAGVRITAWRCERNHGISCPLGAIYFEKANIQWTADYVWKVRRTLIKFVYKSDYNVSISNAFILAIEKLKNFVYIPYDLALDFGVCAKSAITTNITVFDPHRTTPPNLVINFQERLYGCVEVYGKLTVRFTDFILRNVFSVEAWPVVFPFLNANPGATIILENVIIEMDTNATFQTSELRKMVRLIRERSRPEGLGEGKQNLTVWGPKDCQSELNQSRNCRIYKKCPREAECPSGAIFIEDAAFLIEKGDGNDDLGFGVRYHIRHSLITVVPAEVPAISGSDGVANKTVSTEFDAGADRRVETTSKSLSMQVLLVTLFIILSVMCILLLICGFVTYKNGIFARTPIQREAEMPQLSPPYTIKASYPHANPINLDAEAASEALAVRKLESFQTYQQAAQKLLGSVTLGPMLGAGSFGKVFKATWNGATVAVKVVVHDGLSYLGASAQREAMLSSDLHHPNIVQTFLQTTHETKPEKTILMTPTAILEGGQGSTSHSKQTQDTVEDLGNNNQGLGEDAGYFNLQDLVDDGHDLPQQDPFGDQYGGSHSSVGTLLDGSGDIGNRIETWMIQEFCDMGSLEKAIRKGKFIKDERLDMVLVVETCVDICRGMIYLNNRNIIHGDLKSSNILLNGSLHEEKGFVAKVADFGLSRQLGMHASHIKTQTTGTVTHMPPELFREEKMTAASDVYSFGIVMWELVSKESPLEGVPQFLIIKKIVYDNWRPTFTKWTPSCYISLAQKCWAEDSIQRPSIQQVLIELEEMKKLFQQDRPPSSPGSSCDVT